MNKLLLILVILLFLFTGCPATGDGDGDDVDTSLTINISDIPIGADGNTIWITVYRVTSPIVSVEDHVYETVVNGTNMTFLIKESNTSDVNELFIVDQEYEVDVHIDLDGDADLDATNGDYASNDNSVTITDETELDIEVTDVGGTVTLSFTDSSAYNDHSVYFTIYDSNKVDPVTYGPTGTVLGQGTVAIASDVGTGVTMTMDRSSEAVFCNTTFYIGGMVDMNDNVASTETADSGDFYGDFITITVDDENLTVNLDSTAFPLQIP